MIDKDLINRKLDDILSFLEELETLLKFQDEDIGSDFLKLRAAERLLQLIVDTMMDINLHIIRAERLAVPDDFEGSFSLLAKQGILPKEFAERISPAVGLRNRIVHRYATVGMKRFLGELREDCGDFSRYAAPIKKHIG